MNSLVIAAAGPSAPARFIPLRGVLQMNQAIISLASFHARIGAGETLGEQLEELLHCARRDPACQRCELQRVAADEWQLRSHWDSDQELQAHLGLPHMKLLGRLVESGLIRRMQMRVEPRI